MYPLARRLLLIFVSVWNLVFSADIFARVPTQNNVEIDKIVKEYKDNSGNLKTYLEYAQKRAPEKASEFSVFVANENLDLKMPMPKLVRKGNMLEAEYMTNHFLLDFSKENEIKVGYKDA